MFEELAKLKVEDLPENVPLLAKSVEVLRGEYARRKGLDEKAERIEQVEGADPNTGEAGDEGSEEQADAREDAAEDSSQTQPDAVSTVPTLDAETIYVAIGSPDSTIVYYKLSKGIRKPHDIPDE